MIDRFLSSIEGLAPSTKQRYAEVVRDFLAVVGKKNSYTREDVLKYIKVLGDEGSRGTYRGFCFTVLKTFYETMEWPWWTRREERRVKPKNEEPTLLYLRKAEMEKLLEAIASKPPMVQALIRITTITPTRRVELHRLNREDYQPPHLYIKTAKGGLPAALALDPETLNLLDKYLNQRTDTDPALFISGKGNRISISTLSNIFREILTELNLYKRGLGWHGNRRGVTTILHKAGMSERELQEYGRWKSPFMPHKYIQLEPGEVDAKVKKVHPLIKFKEGKK